MKKVSFLLTFVLLLTSAFILKLDKQNRYVPKDGFVPDKETALRIAEAVWYPIYGSGINESKPFKATLKDSAIWVVEGTLKKNFKGGVPYIEIQKMDCKILQVYHTK
jgi:hypothetical protein